MKLFRILIFVFSLVALVLVACHFLLKPELAVLPGTSSEMHSANLSVSQGNVSNSTSTHIATQVPNPEVAEKLQVLAEIFKSKNDNDPRMDQVLKNLSEPVKLALQKQYSETKMEMRNERGTIAFLIGRELAEGRGSLTDVEFLKNILLEKPCLSLLDCSKASTGGSSEEEHLEGIHETTAHYPQLMDLRYLKQALESGNLTPEMKASIIATLEAARHSPNERVVQEAEAILNSVQNK